MQIQRSASLHHLDKMSQLEFMLVEKLEGLGKTSFLFLIQLSQAKINSFR